MAIRLKDRIEANIRQSDKVNNSLSINGKTFNGSQAITVGTLGAAYGGTGETSLINASNALLNALTVGTTTPIDQDYYISQYVGGGTTNTTFHRRSHSALYSYIKNKAEGTWNITTKALANNVNTITDQATLDAFRGSTGLRWAAVQGPTTGLGNNDGLIISIPWPNHATAAVQLVIDDAPSSAMWFRGSASGGTWGDWHIVLHDHNYTSYTVTKTGSGASGTWGISISGNAATATTATKATQDASGNTITSTYLKLTGGTMTGTITTPGNDTVVIKPAKHNYDQIGSADCQFWKIYAGTFYGTLSGNATSADSTTKVKMASTGIADTTTTDSLLEASIVRFDTVGSGGTTINNDGIVATFGWSTQYGAQIWLDDGSGAASIQIRNRTATAWNAWRRVWVSGDSITGAVWNDYAEYRESNCQEFGRVLVENGDDSLSISNFRLQPFAGVSSDTWGFCQGETEKAKTPIAVAGRVLVYPYQDRENYKPGDCVCAAPNGTVDIMTRQEVIQYPDRIVGTVSCIPNYEEWGQGDRPAVKVDGRIWIKVR